MTVRELHGLDELREASRVFASIWGRDAMPVHLLRALEHAGNYVAGAFDDSGTMVGASAGFLGARGSERLLHSHITGVVQSLQNHHVGFALKQHQRRWALSRGVEKIEWTYDPLVRRNAFFNLARLGAEAAAYLEDFYGEMGDDVNAGDRSDRLLVRWSLWSERAVAAVDGNAREPHTEGAAVILSEADDTSPVVRLTWDTRIGCAVPPDIVAIRAADPAIAALWRDALRDTLGEAMRRGYAVDGFARAGFYVLTR